MSAPLTGVARFGEPVRISPLIKFARYAALFSGIAYGYTRNNFLQRRADRLKAIRDKRIAERLERERLAKLHALEMDVKNLEAVLGTKIA